MKPFRLPQGPFVAVPKKSGVQFGAFNIYQHGGAAIGARLAEVPASEASNSHAMAKFMASSWSMYQALKKAEEWLISTGADGAPLKTVQAAIAEAEGRTA